MCYLYFAYYFGVSFLINLVRRLVPKDYDASTDDGVRYQSSDGGKFDQFVRVEKQGHGSRQDGREDEADYRNAGSFVDFGKDLWEKNEY